MRLQATRKRHHLPPLLGKVLAQSTLGDIGLVCAQFRIAFSIISDREQIPH